MMKFLLKLLLTCAALWLAFRSVAWSDLQEAYHQQQPIYLWAAACAILLQNLCGGLRWHQVRRALQGDVADNPTLTALLYYASSFFNVCVPSTLGGDVARIWLAKHLGGHMKEIIYGVVIDRIMSLAGLAVLVTMTLPWLLPYLNMSRETGIAGTIGIALLAVITYSMMRALLTRLRRMFHIAFVNDMIDALLAITGKHLPLLSSLTWATVAHVTYATAGYALAQSLGIHMSWGTCIVLVPLVLFISTMPISLGGWGIREMGMVGVLALIHIPAAPALMLSIQLGLITTLVSLGGGVFYLLLRK